MPAPASTSSTRCLNSRRSIGLVGVAAIKFATIAAFVPLTFARDDAPAAASRPTPAASAPATPATATPEPATATASYVRIVDDEASQTMTLQLAIRTLKQADGTGPEIHLAGAVHIADKAFYEACQTFLDPHDVVLYEGVRPPGARDLPADASDQTREKITRRRVEFLSVLLARYAGKHARLPATFADIADGNARIDRIAQGMTADGWGRPLKYTAAPVAPGEAEGKPAPLSVTISSDGPNPASAEDDIVITQNITPNKAGEPEGIQKQLADALGLKFQLDHVDTSKPNWRNSDMSADEVAERIEANGGDPGMLLNTLSGQSLGARAMGLMLRIIGMNKTMSTTVKVMMVEVLASSDTMLDQAARSGSGPMASMAPMMKVILHDRNEVVMNDIARILRDEPGAKSVAAFYGAGHMAGLEAELISRLGLKVVEERWIDAITVDFKSAGMSAAEAKRMRGMVQRQMQSVRGAPGR
jgi:hypothetical protein